MIDDSKIIPFGNYTNRPIGKVRPTKEVAEQQRAIRDLSARYRKLRKGARQPPIPKPGGDAA